MSDHTTESQQENMGDEGIAKRIRYAVDALNLILSVAAKRGLEVEIDSHDISAMGEYPGSRRIYNAKVFRRTNL